MTDGSIGCIWLNEGKQGRYLTGKVTVDGKEVKIVAFKNKYKEAGDNKPDYKIYVSKPKDSE